ncbi:MAG: zf-HC2 domain-containing protein [Lachnospiraceae bacterium]|nr:zf-HC2 domain-containing protein [Lachnospiraceae bacterium]MBP5222313.1 zf-HC2 domain-containing protein [Lachnospiraceae bacterium]
MDCKQFEKKIPDYIHQKMDYPTLKEFYEHMEECPDCKEELTISFLVMDGLQRLEDGEAFDLQKEWRIRMEESKHRIRISDAWIRIGQCFEVVTAAALAGIVLWLLL